ncbi:PD-(D/E)XK nuclease family protein [Desulfosoma caldarium]|uniref:DUF3782 domain-containing protein n=1 Tax=Desulfosoma caldarium TaxID=610254 RepID=A0A3N1VI79_9BACT|nr:DUF3782 domain-containing protein [Desulfosoma caldarium]ROR01610.1 hypothetical protein EDC27_0789 [Desulfosoma caldarium]
MENEPIIELIRRELPGILQRHPEVRDWVLRLTRDQYADKEETESRFDRLLEELRRDREENARKWDEQNRRWEEQNRELNRKWEEQNRRWEEHNRELNRKWEEQNRKWNEQNRRWEEQARMWDEQNRRWEEQARMWEEQNRRWEEQNRELNRKWEEQNRRWEEQARMWEEQNRRWEEQNRELNRKWEEQNRKWDEQNRRWEEQARMWDEQNRRWEEQARMWDEQNRRWEEQNRKWDTNQKTINEILETLKAQAQKHESSIGALGARWGLTSEASFRNGLRAILEKSFGVQVRSVTEYDERGEVFEHPDQVELDVVVHDDVLILCEIKSSMSKSDMYAFERKVRFYEKRHQRKASRKLVISPMVDDRARQVAQRLGIEVYSYANDVKPGKPSE